MKRRNFLKNTAAATTLPIMLGGLPVHAINRNPLLDILYKNAMMTDRVLVLIQLNGGNDGLNTVVPLNEYGNLSLVRPQVILPELSILRLNTDTGLHPALTGFKQLYDSSKLTVLQNVGYDNPNFSHFRSTDIWLTGSPSNEVYSTGWLGRYLDMDHGGYPANYPNDDFPDPLAITVGSIVSNTCQGLGSNFGMAIRSLDEFNQLQTGGTGGTPNNRYGIELDFIRQSMLQTNQYLGSIQDAASAGNNLSQLYPQSGNRLADQLRIVAQLISGGLRTPFYVVNLGGFDTHIQQVNSSDHLAGRHADLMFDLNEAVTAFQDDLELMGIQDRVLGMTFSEFGRRIRGNDSYGTDHGAAAPMMLFGSQVNGQIIGQNPIIDPAVDETASIPADIDFRSVYGSVLMDWFCVDENDIKTLLYNDFQRINILPPDLSCDSATSVKDLLNPDLLSQNYPNPFQSSTRIPFSSEGGDLRIDIFNTSGVMIKTLTNRFFAPGEYQITFDAEGLAAGVYYYRLRHNNSYATRSMILTR
ncbi:MAG: DUF1501 domain-containing protein [Bacteroidia bacterium]|nr:DUF1501 domain-containing protein [Bacteroidia bacterium]